MQAEEGLLTEILVSSRSLPAHPYLSPEIFEGESQRAGQSMVSVSSPREEPQ